MQDRSQQGNEHEQREHCRQQPARGPVHRQSLEHPAAPACPATARRSGPRPPGCRCCACRQPSYRCHARRRRARLHPGYGPRAGRYHGRACAVASYRGPRSAGVLPGGCGSGRSHWPPTGSRRSCRACPPASSRRLVRGTWPGSGAAGTRGGRPRAVPRLCLAPAATDSARRPSPARSPSMPVHSTRARLGPGNAPAPPRDNDSGVCRRAALCIRCASLLVTTSSTSPRKARVRCHASTPVQRSSGQEGRSGATTSSS